MKVTFKEIKSAPVNPRFFYNFHNMHGKVGGRRKLHYFEITLSEGNEGYLFIDYSGDSAQMYLDGQIYELKKSYPFKENVIIIEGCQKS